MAWPLSVRNPRGLEVPAANCPVSRYLDSALTLPLQRRLDGRVEVARDVSLSIVPDGAGRSSRSTVSRGWTAASPACRDQDPLAHEHSTARSHVVSSSAGTMGSAAIDPSTNPAVVASADSLEILQNRETRSFSHGWTIAEAAV